MWETLSMATRYGDGGATSARVLRALPLEGTRVHVMGVADCAHA